jgi:hypothetical protein
MGIHDSLAHNLGLVIVKAVQGELVFGARHGEGWGVGVTIFTALANLLPTLPEAEIYLALFHGACRGAADCEGQSPGGRQRDIKHVRHGRSLCTGGCDVQSSFAVQCSAVQC